MGHLRSSTVNGEEITGALASILGAKALKPWKLKRSKDGALLPVGVRLKYTLTLRQGRGAKA